MGVMETFIENQGAISGNNATIAENQMKVYEAGVRAGLAQDPDYQEGYEDGRDAALGGAEWEDILNGNTPVGRAKEADHAAKANHATQADLATNATRAANADRALDAESAALAHEATHSCTADRASEADRADVANHASEATHAENADYSTNAGHATTATSASNSPLWNVDRYVGKISPSIDMEMVRVSHTGNSTSNGTEKSASGQMSIPMINSGKLYLDFKTKTACDPGGGEGRYIITDKVDVYVNEVLVQTFGREYTVEPGGDFSLVSHEGTKDTEYRQLLNVSMGDVVTIKNTLTLRRVGGIVSDSAMAGLTVSDIQLKANIITAHTYHTLEVEA